MKLLSISGLDGSGKSTQIKKLQEYLENKSEKVYYFHAISFSLPQKISGYLKKTSESKPPKSVTHANWITIQLRKFALFIDLIRFKSLLKELENEGYTYLLSDRYFYDSLVNIAFLENKLTFLNYKIKKPDFSFYLSINPQDIVNRDRTIDQGLAYLEKKKMLYDNLAIGYSLDVIDANRPIEEITNEIKEKIGASI